MNFVPAFGKENYLDTISNVYDVVPNGCISRVLIKL